MRVGRRTQELTLEIATVTAELSQRLGRSPTTDDLAEALHLPTDVIVIALGAARSYRTSSLNTSHSGADDTELSETIGQNDPGYALVEDNVLLQPLFAGLPPRERRILTMRFFGDMTQAQIAEHTGISQMQVSRLLKRSLSRLRIETQDLSLSV
jgi:RNA polymerase sigma-B factor